MEHYFSETQSSNPILKKINIQLKNLYIELYSSRGIFSKNRIDRGTKLMIENAKIKGSVLDLGCGFGVVGICIKKLYPKSKVTLTDINERAIELANINAKELNLDINVVKSNIFENMNEKFAVILLNPPQSAGKEICFKMIKESFSHLNKSGFFELVARHNKGGRTYSKYMQEIFGNVKDIAKGGGYRVYLSKKED